MKIKLLLFVSLVLLLAGCGNDADKETRGRPTYDVGAAIYIHCIKGYEFVITRVPYGVGIVQIMPPQECEEQGHDR